MMKKITAYTFAAILFAGITTVADAQTKSAKGYFKMPVGIQPTEYLANTVTVKVKPQYRNLCTNNGISNLIFNTVLNKLGATSVALRFPGHSAPETAFNEQGLPMADISLIYNVKFNNSIAFETAINELYATGLFVYAEPHYVPHIVYVPNDSLAAIGGPQYHLQKINAYAAWDVTKGDTNVVIGVTDTGTEPNHPDLKGNVKHNYKDPINGLDDDNDGYIDNFSGWDVGSNDNDPTWQGSYHGVHVCGIAAASTDNKIGVAGVGFKCKLLPVKIADATGNLIAAYEGITYAADHGADVINCSWGGGTGGQTGQDVINYATVNKGVLVVAAAGNDNLEQDFYPAAYDLVLSVGATDKNDGKAGFSNYAYSVDVSAPGNNIRSTFFGTNPKTSYGNMSGTSMASPVVAGAAALIKSKFPNYKGLQLGEQLKMTADSLTQPQYKGKLGTGRINLFKGVTKTPPGVEMMSRKMTDKNDEAFIIGDTVRITGLFTNFLAAATNVKATLTTTSTDVILLNTTVDLGNIGSNATVNNNSLPFSMLIKPSATINEQIPVKITITADSNYTYSQLFYLGVNVDYINITINDVYTSATSKGVIGYNTYPQKNGYGFSYNGEQLLFEGGFMVGTDTGHVSNCVRGLGTIPAADFMPAIVVKRTIPSVFSDFDAAGKYTDAASAKAIGVSIKHKEYAFTTPGNRKYVIFEYNIHNENSTIKLDSLYAGIMADWDIDVDSSSADRGEYDAKRKMGYVYRLRQKFPYAGIQLLNKQAPPIHYAIDNDVTGQGGVKMSDGYSIAEKYITLSTNRPNAGVSPKGNDIIDVMSTGPYSLNPGDSVVIAFALLAGDSLADLQKSADSAFVHYKTKDILVYNSGITTLSAEGVILSQSYPNPAHDKAFIEYYLPKHSTVALTLYDMLGKEVMTLVNAKEDSGNHYVEVNTTTLQSGIYYYSLKTNDTTLTRKMMVVK